MKPLVALLACALCCYSKDSAAAIAPGSSVYVEPGNGVDVIREAFSVKHVPLRFTDSKSDADYVLDTAFIQTSVDVENEGRVASFPVRYGSVWLESKSGVVVWKHIVSQRIVKRGDRAVAEDVAVHIYEVIAKPRKR